MEADAVEGAVEQDVEADAIEIAVVGADVVLVAVECEPMLEDKREEDAVVGDCLVNRGRRALSNAASGEGLLLLPKIFSAAPLGLLDCQEDVAAMLRAKGADGIDSASAGLESASESLTPEAVAAPNEKVS